MSGGKPVLTQAYVDVNYTENGQAQTVALRPNDNGFANIWETQVPTTARSTGRWWRYSIRQ